MTFELCNSQRRFRIDSRAFRALASALAQAAQREKPQPPWCELTVILTDDAGSAPYNEAIMGHTGPTDVITQRYEPLPGEPPGLVGELIINVEQAWHTGLQLTLKHPAWSPAHELALYLAHGCDHLNDATDATPEERSRMRRREKRWLAELTIAESLIRII